MRLIDADEALLRNDKMKNRSDVFRSYAKVVIDGTPTIDAVSRGVHDQVRWERDIAIKQLEEHGIPFGGIAPDVVKVVHGRWIIKGQDVFCSHCDKESGHNQWGASAFSKYCPNCGAKMDGDGNG